jgi:hypothetical protein
LPGRPENDVPRIEALVLLTARHGQLTPADVDDETARFLDCDMAILHLRLDADARENLRRRLVPGRLEPCPTRPTPRRSPAIYSKSAR